MILLDRDFDVTAVPTIQAPAWGGSAPDVVVLSPTHWSETVAAAARSSCPDSALVFLDPPQTLSCVFPTAAVASWSDPQSVRVAVAEAGVARPAPRASLIDACRMLARLLDADMQRHLATSKTLAKLTGAVTYPSSSYLGTRFLGEQCALLRERLAWVDVANGEVSGAVVDNDLSAILRHSLDEIQVRFACRGLELDWRHREPTLIRSSALCAEVVSRCLRSALLDLSPGRIGLSSKRAHLVCSHGDIQPARPSLPLIVAERLLAHVGMHLRCEVGRLSICPIKGETCP